jgi:hypothetical protein
MLGGFALPTHAQGLRPMLGGFALSTHAQGFRPMLGGFALLTHARGLCPMLGGFALLTYARGLRLFDLRSEALPLNHITHTKHPDKSQRHIHIYIIYKQGSETVQVSALWRSGSPSDGHFR